MRTYAVLDNWANTYVLRDLSLKQAEAFMETTGNHNPRRYQLVTMSWQPTNKKSPIHAITIRDAKGRFRLNRVAHGWIIEDQLSGNKVGFYTRKGQAVQRLKEIRKLALDGIV